MILRFSLEMRRDSFAAEDRQHQADAGGDPDEPVAREDVRVGNVVHDVAPGGERELDAEAEEAERCLGDDGGAEAHRAVDDELRDDVGDQVAEDAARNADAAGLRRGHELLLAQREDLAADETGDTRPAEEAQDQH